MDPSIISQISNDTKVILDNYLKVKSFSNTEGERLVNDFFVNYIKSINYFKNNSDKYGSSKISNDSLGRSVNWAFLDNDHGDTVVFVHHSDIVSIDNYNQYQDIAFEPEKLKEAFLKDESLLDSESIEDLYSDKWLFGRGGADMKGGGSIQLALLKYYADQCDPGVNIIVLAVPDEENWSAGMRSAVNLLSDLKNKYKLNYKLMINSEPHQRLNYSNGVLAQGSIAKMNLFVYVKGEFTHAGKALEGFNPIGVASRIMSKVEINPVFSDTYMNEVSVPPTWIYSRDLKPGYDISMPPAHYSVLNVLNFFTNPSDVISKVKDISKEAFNEALDELNKQRKSFADKTGRNWNDKTYDVKIMDFNELRDGIDLDIEKFLEETSDVKDLNVNIVEYLLKLKKISGPCVIIGLIPPYYPGVSNYLNKSDKNDYLKIINDFTKNKWSQTYDNVNYFTGICDLSYSSMNYELEPLYDAMKSMPLWGNFYNIPFKKIKEVEMPCLNIGPWGKDFHRASERVYKEDLFERTPLLINHVITEIGK